MVYMQLNKIIYEINDYISTEQGHVKTVEGKYVKEEGIHYQKQRAK